MCIHPHVTSLSHLFTGMSISDMYFNTQLMIFLRLSSPNSLEIVCRGGEEGSRRSDGCKHEKSTPTAKRRGQLQQHEALFRRHHNDTGPKKLRPFHGERAVHFASHIASEAQMHAQVSGALLLKQFRRLEMVEQASGRRTLSVSSVHFTRTGMTLLH